MARLRTSLAACQPWALARSTQAPALLMTRSAPRPSAPAGAHPCRSSQIRTYQHHSEHAPTGLNASSRLSYSRQDLVSAWHAAARDVSPMDLSWRGRDEIEARFAIIHANGDIEANPDERLVKEDIINTYGLNPRDLRSLDAHILDVRPSLLVCRQALVVCVPIARAVIAHDHIILIGRDHNNPLCTDEEALDLVNSLQRVMKYLEFTGSASGNAKLPFELRALEALLLLTVKGFRHIVTDIEERVYARIPELRMGVSPRELRDLLEAKRTVDDCLYSGRAFQAALSAVLSEDEDLAAMYLSDTFDNKAHATKDHQAAELLLEYYERRLDEVNESSQRLASLLSDVDDNISLTLASTRVKLQNLELQTAITTLALGAGTALFGLYGMNLESGLEESPTAFFWTTTAGCGIMTVIMGVGWFRLIRARRSQLLLRSAAVPQKIPRPRPALQGDKAGAAAEIKSDTPGPGEKKDGSEI